MTELGLHGLQVLNRLMIRDLLMCVNTPLSSGRRTDSDVIDVVGEPFVFGGLLFHDHLLDGLFHDLLQLLSLPLLLDLLLCHLGGRCFLLFAFAVFLEDVV